MRSDAKRRNYLSERHRLFYSDSGRLEENLRPHNFPSRESEDLSHSLEKSKVSREYLDLLQSLSISYW